MLCFASLAVIVMSVSITQTTLAFTILPLDEAAAIAVRTVQGYAMLS